MDLGFAWLTFARREYNGGKDRLAPDLQGWLEHHYMGWVKDYINLRHEWDANKTLIPFHPEYDERAACLCP